ncbi:hypothetical protein OUZ56_024258 [Daphnia magna]|uniref:Uncharacterized protein n=1 Tax=Daphnia magna TaxID=35525 RepID=A0ABR0B0H2_9CRUS|nr:hypothetical protein OUZ56_024258 [Daphnia magna]
MGGGFINRQFCARSASRPRITNASRKSVVKHVYNVPGDFPVDRNHQLLLSSDIPLPLSSQKPFGRSNSSSCVQP